MKKLAFIMDPIASLKHAKDSSLAMLEASHHRGWHNYYLQSHQIGVEHGEPYSVVQSVSPAPAPEWYALQPPERCKLTEFDAILIRTDPPFDSRYLYTTQLLQLAADQGVLVMNAPAGLQAFNEKLAINHFPQCTAPTLITASKSDAKQFWQTYGSILIKPLDGMGGTGIFLHHADSPNFPVSFDLLSHGETAFVMCQQYIPEISAGDKRILLIDGEPIPFALARLPQKGEFRGNLAAGGRGVSQRLSERDLWICEQVGPTLKRMGLMFVGIDVIGDYLTEVNVTSPTCIRELDALNQINISARLMDHIQSKIDANMK